jgi:hypothetical protein
MSNVTRTQRLRKKVESLAAILALSVGALGFTIGLIEIIMKYFTQRTIDLFAPEVVTLLGLIASFLGVEKLLHRAEIEDKNVELIKHLEALKGIEIIESHHKVNESTAQEVQQVEQKIRVTNFKPASKDNDTDISYYKALYECLLNKNIRYECAILDTVDVGNRFHADHKLSDDKNKAILNKQTFFVFEDSTPYMNVLIIDHKIAYIGFYTHKDDQHMDTVIRISDKSESGKLLIYRLVNWYDSLMKPAYVGEKRPITAIEGKDFYNQFLSRQNPGNS